MSNKKSMNFSVVVAIDNKNGIGRNGNIPWVIPDDIKNFKYITCTAANNKINAVIMGYKTFYSIPEQNRPLPDRHNIVISREPIHGVKVVPSLDAAMEYINNEYIISVIDKVYVIGGSKLINEAMVDDRCRYLHITHVYDNYNCDVKINQIDNYIWKRVFIDNKTANVTFKRTINYAFATYERRRFKSADQIYIDEVVKILEDGEDRNDRTGTGTKSVFGIQMQFDLTTQFPLLTTKKMPWNIIVEELLWFIRGETNVKSLNDKHVHIWDSNSSREFLDKCNLKYSPGELGPIYGFQWRNWNGIYPPPQIKYAVEPHSKTKILKRGEKFSNTKIDQLKECINLIKTDPTSRRIIMTAWNPAQLSMMALPPCHVLVQFQVSQGRLNAHLFQRSGDMGLGVPFNIASYALLTCMIAHVCNLKPGKLVHSISDAHIYINHIDALKDQIYRMPLNPAQLTINGPTDIDSLSAESFILKYESHESIKMKMAI